MGCYYLPYEPSFTFVILPQGEDPAHEIALMSMRHVHAENVSSAAILLKDVSPNAIGFHFLFASDIQAYFEMCKKVRELGVHSSALTESEIASISLLKTQLSVTEDEGLGPEIYVAVMQELSGIRTLSPIRYDLRPTREYDTETPAHHLPLHAMRYVPLNNQELFRHVQKAARQIYEGLQVKQPLIFGFNTTDSGELVLVNIMVSFGLTAHSLLPTMLLFEGIPLEEFIHRVYFRNRH